MTHDTTPAAPAWTYLPENLPAARAAGYCPKCGSLDTFTQGAARGCHACAYGWTGEA